MESRTWLLPNENTSPHIPDSRAYACGSYSSNALPQACFASADVRQESNDHEPSRTLWHVIRRTEIRATTDDEDAFEKADNRHLTETASVLDLTRTPRTQCNRKRRNSGCAQ